VRMNHHLLFALPIMLLLTACSGAATEPTPTPTLEPTFTPVPTATPDPLAEADIARGQEIFETGAGITDPPCSTCHTLDRDDTPPGGRLFVGPSLEGFAARADAFAYIEQSIKDPNAFVVEGYKQMPSGPGLDLSDQDILDVTAYLLSLE